MNPGDEVLYPNPGYPIYESQIEYFGGIAKPYRYIATGTGFSIDLDQIKSLITPRTKAIVYNDLQNPNGAESTDAEREAIAEIAIANNLYVLSDEAYFEMRYEGKSKSIASLPGMAERTVILYTFSKKFAMTGWRLGAAIAPKEIADVISKLNTNDESCTTHFVQYGGVEAVTGDQSGVPVMLNTLKQRRDTALELLRQMPGVKVHTPEAGFYMFPDVTEAATGTDDITGSPVFDGEIAEASTGSDALTSVVSLLSDITETATGSDATTGGQVYDAAVAGTGWGESAWGYNSWGGIGEIAVISDVVTSTLTLNVSLSETATGTDEVLAGSVFAAQVTEAATGSDEILGSPTYAVAVTETATGSDSVSSVPVYAAVVDESATGTDSVTSSFVFFGTIEEAATGSDAISAALTLPATVTESATGSDAVTTTASFGAAVTETATSADTLAAAAAFIASINELATGTDTVNGRPFWEIIDDTQNANWQNIGNTQTAGWTAIATN
jgi:hypothetical protein